MKIKIFTNFFTIFFSIILSCRYAYAECTNVDWKLTRENYTLEIYNNSDDIYSENPSKVNLKKYNCNLVSKKDSSDYFYLINSESLYKCNNLATSDSVYLKRKVIVNRLGGSQANSTFFDKSGKEFDLKEMNFLAMSSRGLDDVEKSFRKYEGCNKSQNLSIVGLYYPNSPVNIMFDLYIYRYYDGVKKPVPEL